MSPCALDCASVSGSIRLAFGIVRLLVNPFLTTGLKSYVRNCVVICNELLETIGNSGR